MPQCARLATWTTAWLAGDTSFDDVLEAMDRSGARHVVQGLTAATARGLVDGGRELPRARLDAGHSLEPRQAPADADLAGQDRIGAVLIAWRAVTDSVRVVLPVPGDVRGVPGPGDFGAAALAAGQAVIGGGVGLVPSGGEPTASSATPTVVWTAYAIGAAAPDVLQLSEAEHELTAAMRETATLFRAADLTGSRSGVGDDLVRARRAGEHLDLPPGFPSRAVALAAQAERLSAVLDIAGRDTYGGAVDRDGIGTRAEALRTLAGTVRRARQAAYNAGVPVR